MPRQGFECTVSFLGFSFGKIWPLLTQHCLGDSRHSSDLIQSLSEFIVANSSAYKCDLDTCSKLILIIAFKCLGKCYKSIWNMAVLALSKFKSAQIFIKKKNPRFSFRTVLQADSPQHDIEILKPVNMLLSIQRNLSAAWYTQIPGMEITGKLKPMQVSV